MLVLSAGALAGALTSIASAGTARANGRFPASNQIVFSPTDPNVVALRATFGVLLSRDSGATWSWLCEDVFGVSQSSPTDPVIALSASSMVAGPGLGAGLAVSPDLGCAWASAADPLRSQLVKDLVVTPQAPHAVLAVTSTYHMGAGTDGGPGYVQQLFASDDDGASWSAKGTPIDPATPVTTVDVAPGDPTRIYVSALRGAGQTRTASLFVSTDGGAAWVERPVPIDVTRESEVFIAAVDPQNADRVYLRTLGTASRLLVTDDAGQSFTSPLALEGPMNGFALSPDGAKVYAGGPEDGLFMATRDALAFERRSAIHVQCLAARGPELWACSDEPSGFIAGASDDDGATFIAKAHLVAEPALACPADAAATQCGGDPWQSLCALLPGCPAAGDAGPATGDAGPAAGDAAPAAGDAAPTAGDGEASETKPSGKACACAGVGVQSQGPDRAVSWAAALAVAAVARLRRRRARVLLNTARPWTFCTSSCSSARSSSSTSPGISRSPKSSA
jgi:photosystem II stability/assembly factor-like uncharacterized protein